MPASIQPETPEIRQEVVSNLGFWQVQGQLAIEKGRVAVAGLGGAGGMVVEVAARLGVHNWALADPDSSDISNIGRQAGAFQHTRHLSKVDTARQAVQGVHHRPTVDSFYEGLQPENAEQFAHGADIILEAIDYSQAHLSALLGRVARRNGIPMLTSIEVGDGCQYTLFRANPTDYDQTSDAYFGIDPDQTITADTEISVDRMLSFWPYYASPQVLELAMEGAIPTPANATGVTRNASAISRAIRQVLQGNVAAVDAISYPYVVIDDPDPLIGVTRVHHDDRKDLLDSSLEQAAVYAVENEKLGRKLFSVAEEYKVVG